MPPLNFPNPPLTNGTVYTVPGVGSWIWDTIKWNGNAAGGNSSLTLISDTPPTITTPGTLWWNSSPGSGQLYISYNDGDSTQWVATSNLGAGNQFLPLTGGVVTGPVTISGAFRTSGGAINLGAYTWAQLNTAFNNLGGSGAIGVGWNYSGGGGETDFFVNRGGGANGGLVIYDFPNTSGTPFQMMSLSSTGLLIIPSNAIIGGSMTLGGGVQQNARLTFDTSYTNTPPIINKIDLYNNQFGFGLSGGSLDFISQNFNFYNGPTLTATLDTSGNFSAIGTGSFGKAATANTLVGGGNLAVMRTPVGPTSYWDLATASFQDSTAMAQGVGGAINFLGKYTTAGAWAAFGGIVGRKTNGTDGDFTGNLAIWARSGQINLFAGGGQIGVGQAASFTTGSVSFPGALTVGGNTVPSTMQAGMIYANIVSTWGGSALYNNVYIDTGGAGHLIANAACTALNMGSGQFQFYSAPAGAVGSAAAWTSMAVIAGGNLTLNSYYLTWAGAGASGVNGTTNGPLIYADQNNMVFHVGTNSASQFVYQGYTGALCCAINSNANAGTGANSVIIPNATWYAGYDTGGTSRALIAIWNDNNVYVNNTDRIVHVRGTTVSIEATNNSKGTGIMMGFHCWPTADNVYWCGYTGYQESWTGACSYQWVNASDGRNKHDIEELPLCLAIVNRLVPKRYKFNNAPPEDRGKTHWGFVAQDVEEATRGLECGAHRNDNGQHGVVYHELTAILWKAVQELSAELAEVKAKL